MPIDFLEPKKRDKRATVNLSDEEFEAFQQLVAFRKEKGKSTDAAHTIRQMLHFVCNREYFKGYDFAVPDFQTEKAVENV